MLLGRNGIELLKPVAATMRSNSPTLPSVKWTLVPDEAGDVRARLDAALAQVVEHVGAERRMALEQLVVGLLQAVLAIVADEDAHQRAQHQPLQEHRQAPDRQIGERLAERGLGQEPVAGAQAQIARGADARRFAGDVAAGVAAADDEHALALQLLGILVVLRMDQRAGKAAAILRQALVPVVAVADDDALVGALLAVLERHLPALVGERHGARHLAAQLEAVGEAAIVREAFEIAQHLRAAGKVGVVRRHRVVGVAGRLLGGDDVHALVDAVAPEAADAVAGVDEVECDAALLQRGSHRQADGPRTDDKQAIGSRRRSTHAPSQQ